ncbi:MAG: Isoleucine--tRNA ligase [Alphaproteobacteria bacterium ADurb.Bin438]|nr:MAG: Isoleucine--tRNA ligase [Alphaproteobacteria bacterium ADurb.Bin438]
MVSSPILRGGNLSIDKEGKEIQKSTRKAILPLWNAYYFFTIYANADEVKAKEISCSSDVLDMYILSKLKELKEKLTVAMDKHDIVEATTLVEEFLEILNNWYIRRSRQRFWSLKEFGCEAFDTLYTVLINLCKMVAPLAPMISEFIYRNLTGNESVHLENWPELAEIQIDNPLISKMDFVRLISSNAKAVREDNKLRNRLPLQSMMVAGEGVDKLTDFFDILKDELNVKEVKVEKNVEALAEKFLYVKTPLVGKRLSQYMKVILAASKLNQWELNADGTLAIAGQTLLKEEFEMRLVLKEGLKGQALPDNTAVIVLDTTLYPELIKEGMARDFVRAIQSLRKEKDFDVSDRIALIIKTDNEEVKQAITEYKEYIMEQVLALSFEFADKVENENSFEIGEGLVFADAKVV